MKSKQSSNVMNNSNSSANKARPNNIQGKKLTKSQTVCCACHSFLRQWLSGRTQLSQDDFAAAVLIHLFWESKSMSGERDAFGLGFQLGVLDILGVKFPSGGMEALRRLEAAGIIKLRKELPAEKAAPMLSSSATSLVLVELPWLSDDGDRNG